MIREATTTVCVYNCVTSLPAGSQRTLGVKGGQIRRSLDAPNKASIRPSFMLL